MLRTLDADRKSNFQTILLHHARTCCYRISIYTVARAFVITFVSHIKSTLRFQFYQSVIIENTLPFFFSLSLHSYFTTHSSSRFRILVILSISKMTMYGYDFEMESSYRYSYILYKFQCIRVASLYFANNAFACKRKIPLQCCYPRVN